MQNCSCQAAVGFISRIPWQRKGLTALFLLSILEVPPCVASKYLFGEDVDSSCRKRILEVPSSVATKYLLGGDVDLRDASDEGSLGSSPEHRLAEF